MSLSLFEFTKVLQIFDLDVLLVAVAVTVLTGLAKLKISEKLKKYVTFFPFIIGTVAYGAFTAVFLKADPFIPRTITMGIECGVAATIYYVVYEQFIKGAGRARGTDEESAVADGATEFEGEALEGATDAANSATTEPEKADLDGAEAKLGGTGEVGGENFAEKSAQESVRDILDAANEIINKFIKK
jgi:hypothetical protein